MTEEDYGGLRKEVVEYISTLKLGGQIRLKDIRPNGALFHRLGELARKRFGVYSPGRILREMELPINGVMNTDEILEVCKRAIPESTARAVYGAEERRSIKELFGALGPEGIHAYFAIQNKRRNDHSKEGLSRVVNSLYPKLMEEYGCTLWDAFHGSGRRRSDEEIKKELEFLLYKGLDLSRDSLMAEGHRGLVRQITRLPSDDSMMPFMGGAKKRGRRDYRKTVIGLLGFNPFTDLEPYGPDRERFGRMHVRREDREGGVAAPIVTGIIGQRLVELMLRVLAKYDPKATEMPESFGKYFPGGVREVLTTERERSIEGCKKKETDIRVKPDDGSVGHCLVEVKTLTPMALAENGRNTLKDYGGISEWTSSPHRINGRVLITPSNGLKDSKKKKSELAISQLEGDGWRVMREEDFEKFYKKSLDILLREDKDFFLKAPVHVANPKNLREIQETVGHRLSVLQRRGNRFLREWLSRMLYDNLLALEDSDLFDEPRSLPPRRKVVPFSSLSRIYGPRVEGRLSKNSVFLDLETAGFRNTGSPAFLIGLAYYDNERGEMVAEQFFSRDPLEEKENLEETVERLEEFKRVVTFNGSSFDIPFLKERLAANLVRPGSQEQGHDDLYPEWRRVRGMEGKSSATLQTFERSQLSINRHGIEGMGDISGYKIPETWRSFLTSGQTEGVESVLHHNVLDLVTLVLLDKHLERK